MAVTLAGVGLLVALALTLAPGDAAPGGGGRPPPATRARSAFLQEQLPLKVVLTTPVEIVRAAQPDEPVRVWGRQTLTVRGASAFGLHPATTQGPRAHPRHAHACSCLAPSCCACLACVCLRQRGRAAGTSCAVAAGGDTLRCVSLLPHHLL